MDIIAQEQYTKRTRMHCFKAKGFHMNEKGVNRIQLLQAFWTHPLSFL